jgi:hypothetical protein
MGDMGEICPAARETRRGRAETPDRSGETRYDITAQRAARSIGAVDRSAADPAGGADPPSSSGARR